MGGSCHRHRKVIFSIASLMNFGTSMSEAEVWGMVAKRTLGLGA